MSRDAYLEGQDAGREGQDQESNPYPVSSKHRVRWNNGWLKGVEEFQQAQTEMVQERIQVGCFSDETSGRILVCFFDNKGDWHMEYFQKMHTKDLSVDQPHLREYYINDHLVPDVLFRAMVATMDEMAGGDILPIPEILREEGT